MHVNINQIQDRTTQTSQSRSIPRQHFCGPVRVIKDTWKVAGQGADPFPRTLRVCDEI